MSLACPFLRPCSTLFFGFFGVFLFTSGLVLPELWNPPGLVWRKTFLAKTRKELFYLLAEDVFFFFNKGGIIRGVVFLWGHLCTEFSVALI